MHTFLMVLAKIFPLNYHCKGHNRSNISYLFQGVGDVFRFVSYLLEMKDHNFHTFTIKAIKAIYHCIPLYQERQG